MIGRAKSKPGPEGEEKMVGFSVRHLRLDLRDKLRICAALNDCTIEDVLNDALALGLPKLYKRAIQSAKLRRREADPYAQFEADQ